MNLLNKDQLESQIVSLLQAGNQQAVSLIYQNYSDTLYGLILKVIPSKEIAQEVLQDTFVKIWKNAHQYDSKKGRLFTWFANIARNTAIDRVRSAQFRREQKTGSIESLVQENEYGSEELSVRDSGLKKIIDSLDEKHRVLIELAYFQNYTQREIEKELGIPLGTIKSRIRTAINELRTKLGSDFDQNLLTLVLILTLIYLIQ